MSTRDEAQMVVNITLTTPLGSAVRDPQAKESLQKSRDVLNNVIAAVYCAMNPANNKVNNDVLDESERPKQK